MLPFTIWDLYRDAQRPGTRETALIVDLPQGTSAKKTCEILSSLNIGPHPWACLLGGSFFGNLRSLKAGEYDIAPQASFLDALQKISRGDVIVYFVTLPEGLTSYEIVERLKELPKLEGEVNTIPSEGTLFPSTYTYQKRDTRDALLTRMAQEMNRITTQLWAERPRECPLTSPKEMVVLASLIEKETALPSEHTIVSAVFHNRLKKGMRLQCDPTVIYGLSKGTGKLGRDLNSADLLHNHPLNTYVHAGLPPQPIANPGVAALKAALHPAAVTYLYFVADGTGGHQFSKTLEEHHKLHQKWRKLKKIKNQNAG